MKPFLGSASALLVILTLILNTGVLGNVPSHNKILIMLFALWLQVRANGMKD